MTMWACADRTARPERTCIAAPDRSPLLNERPASQPHADPWYMVRSELEHSDFGGHLRSEILVTVEPSPHVAEAENTWEVVTALQTVGGPAHKIMLKQMGRFRRTRGCT
jgi:hypothetical protein